MWPCRRDTGSQLSSSWEGRGVPCKLSWKRTQKHHSGLQGCRKVYGQRKDISPDVRHGVPVLVVCCPDGYFISFRTNIDHGSTHIVAVVIKGLADQTQELQNSWSSARKETNPRKYRWSRRFCKRSMCEPMTQRMTQT